MKQRLLDLARDRLVWFVALGLLLFAADRAAERREADLIRIDLPLVEKLAAQWEGQTKRRPDGRELDALIEGYIREEILVREAMRLGLDDNDVIIRRRLAQKVEFLLGDGAADAAQDEAALRVWFAENSAAYGTPETISWQHVFAGNEAEAEAFAGQMNADDSNWRGRGRPFMLNRNYARHDRVTLAQLMGGDFAAALFAESRDGWVGPVRSAYGWHAVKITGRQAAQPAAFEAVAERVARDKAAADANAARAAAWADLRAQYRIELQPLEAE